MMAHERMRHRRVIHPANSSGGAPLRFAEYAYYSSMFYSALAPALGLSVNLGGAGIVAVLAAFCVMCLASRARTVYAPIVPPLGCAVSSLVLQLTAHGESLLQPDNRAFFTWMLTLIVVQSLT